jgi:hypothetical protein
MQALSAYIACVDKRQYTVRGVSPALADRVREEARRYDASVNATLLDALARGLGAGAEPAECHDLDDLAGTWIEDAAFDEAVAAFQSVDEALWR